MIHRRSKTLSLAVIVSCLFIGFATVPASAASPSNQGEPNGTHGELRENAANTLSSALQNFLIRMRSLVVDVVQTVQQVVTGQNPDTCT